MGEDSARAVLDCYPDPYRQGQPTFLGNRGGFSGARLWRVTSVAGDCCLRAWPPSGPGKAQLAEIHQWMELAKQSGLDFVPTVVRARSGDRCVERAGRLWDLTSWQPGQADFHLRPEPQRLEAACVALAALHGAWACLACPGRSVGIRRRLALTGEWPTIAAQGPRGLPIPDSLADWLERGTRAVKRHLPRLPARLQAWRERTLPIQPCLADLWHDHVLFTGDVVTGIIDYGSARRDHVAADLARLLGSLAGDRAHLRQAGLAAYTQRRPLTLEEEELVTLLDESAALLGIVNWLKWLCVERRVYTDLNAVQTRLASLVERVEGW